MKKDDDSQLFFCSGLPYPKPDQTEEMLVESMLKVVDLPAATVRTAVRLPIKSKTKVRREHTYHRVPPGNSKSGLPNVQAYLDIILNAG